MGSAVVNMDDPFLSRSTTLEKQKMIKLCTQRFPHDARRASGRGDTCTTHIAPEFSKCGNQKVFTRLLVGLSSDPKSASEAI